MVLCHWESDLLEAEVVFCCITPSSPHAFCLHRAFSDCCRILTQACCGERTMSTTSLDDNPKAFLMWVSTLFQFLFAFPFILKESILLPSFLSSFPPLPSPFFLSFLPSFWFRHFYILSLPLLSLCIEPRWSFIYWKPFCLSWMSSLMFSGSHVLFFLGLLRVHKLGNI